MTSTAQGIYPVLFPTSLIKSQEFWNKNFPIIKNDHNGYPVYLGALNVMLQEGIFFFKKDPERSNGLQLILACTLVWQIIRSFAGLEGDDLAAFRKKVNMPLGDARIDTVFEGAYGDDVVPFIKSMYKVHEIHSFIRHPQSEFNKFNWVLFEKWPSNEVEALIQAAGNLRTILVFLSQDMAQSAGWVGDKTKTVLHEEAKRVNKD